MPQERPFSLSADSVLSQLSLSRRTAPDNHSTEPEPEPESEPGYMEPHSSRERKVPRNHLVSKIRRQFTFREQYLAQIRSLAAAVDLARRDATEAAQATSTRESQLAAAFSSKEDALIGQLLDLQSQISAAEDRERDVRTSLSEVRARLACVEAERAEEKRIIETEREKWEMEKTGFGILNAEVQWEREEEAVLRNHLRQQLALKEEEINVSW